MRALRLDFTTRQLSVTSHAEPEPPRSGQVRLRIVECGVCGTDRGVAEFEFGSPPAGEDGLILGHEAVAVVDQTGDIAGKLARGQLVVPLVRRNCGPGCAMCRRGRRDNCLTGEYVERGILGLHGYLCEFAVDNEEDLVAVPERLAEVAVLVEPASVVEKAWALALRLHPGEPRRVLVLGAGPIGILAAWWALSCGFEVTVLSREDAESDRARLLMRHGVQYAKSLDGLSADIVIEACGNAALAIESMRVLRRLGIIVLLGARPAEVRLPCLDMIIGNHILAASVNASYQHFELAVARLGAYDRSWLDPLIHRLPLSQSAATIARPPAGAVKIVHRISD